MHIKGSMEVEGYKFTVQYVYLREYGSTGVQVCSTICLLKGVWKYRSTSLHFNMYIKGSLQGYKFTVQYIY